MLEQEPKLNQFILVATKNKTKIKYKSMPIYVKRFYNS